MRDNGRSALLASTMTPNLVMLTLGLARWWRVQIATWRVPRRGTLPAHRAADEHSRCPGSGQRVTIDLTPVLRGDRGHGHIPAVSARGDPAGMGLAHSGADVLATPEYAITQI